MHIPVEVEKVLKILQDNGYAAFTVGGCVRDFLLEKTPYDYDVTTDALPRDVMKLFSGFPVIPTGIKHGTVTVLIGRTPIEVTTFRTDGAYLDNRRPSEVTFSKNIEDDLKRRDFTVNAIAYSQASGFVDIFGGRQDLKDRVIRCVGDAGERFGEDALRIMRAIRLAAALGFNIDEKTSRSLHEKKELLRNISAERINMEFSRLLLSGRAAEFLVSYRDVMGVFIPEIADDPHLADKADLLEKTGDLSVKLAVLLDGLFNGQEAGAFLGKMKYDNKTVHETVCLLRYKNRRIKSARQPIKLWLKTFGKEAFMRLLELKGLTEDVAAQRKTVQEIMDGAECYSLKSLAINGRDLMNAGEREGSEIGRILNRILIEVILGELPNEKAALAEYAKKWTGDTID